eukprot:scaffold133247_cov16-Prasinocladus_malaysianus.AAC.1
MPVVFFQQHLRPTSIPRSPGASPERPRPSAASPGVFSQGAPVANHEPRARARHHPDSRGILSGGQGPSLLPSVASRERHEHMVCQQPASPASPVAPAVAFDVASENVQPGGPPADPSKVDQRKARVQAMLDAKRERYAIVCTLLNNFFPVNTCRLKPSMDKVG